MNGHSGIHRIIIADFFLEVVADLQRHGPVDLFVVVAIYLHVLIFFHLFELFVFDYEVAIMADNFLAVVLYANVLIFFGMNKYLFLSLLVLDAKFIKTASARAGIRFDRRFRLFVG